MNYWQININQAFSTVWAFEGIRNQIALYQNLNVFHQNVKTEGEKIVRQKLIR